MPPDELQDLKERLILDVRERWHIPEAWRWPWLLRPCTVRILFYADFAGAFSGGSFDGLKHVIAVLNADPYFWVKFQISLANRGADASADADKQGKRLDQLDLNNKYDELWLFGLQGLPSGLTAREVGAVESFMDVAKGGVLVTGDHYDLGAAIASGIPRVGRLRAWPGPTSSGLDKNSTLREGDALTSPGYQFEDQSDDVPQSLRLRRYPLPSFPLWKRRSMPHPLMCGPLGPITAFPDHMHEGEITIPSTFPAAEWPSSGGVQPKPEVVAWGRIVEPGLTKTGQEFGVVGAYDGHLADVGRIAADSTWHHWFDINLIGDNGLVGGSTGFHASAAGKAALKQIEAYYLNVAVWLAPPAQQACMRNRLWWGGLWRDPLIMMSPDLPIYLLGEHARDALGKYAPQCTIYTWTWWLLPVRIRLRFEELLVQPGPVPPYLEECLLGAALRPLLAAAREEPGIPEAKKINEERTNRLLNDAFAQSAQLGIEAFLSLLDESRSAAQSLARLATKGAGERPSRRTEK